MSVREWIMNTYISIAKRLKEAIKIITLNYPDLMTYVESKPLSTLDRQTLDMTNTWQTNARHNKH